MTKQSQSNTFDTLEVSHFWARHAGPGVRLYPAPYGRADVPALALGRKWVEVPQAYSEVESFTRDRRAGVFEFMESATRPPDDLAEIDPALAEVLSFAERETVKAICLTPGDLSAQYRDVLSVADLVDEAGKPTRIGASVTITFLRERHRPFLECLADLESRAQNRPAVLALIKKQLRKIEGLPAAGR